MFIRLEWIPRTLVRRWKEQPPIDPGERQKLGETRDEAKARADLYGKRRREFLTGASGGGWRRK